MNHGKDKIQPVKRLYRIPGLSSTSALHIPWPQPGHLPPLKKPKIEATETPSQKEQRQAKEAQQIEQFQERQIKKENLNL